MLRVSDIPGDPGSQLPYKEFSPYYLAPILLAFPISLRQVVSGFLPFASSLPFSRPLVHNATKGGCGLYITLAQSTFPGVHTWTPYYGFFCDIATSSALNRSVQLDAPFAIFFLSYHGFIHFHLQLLRRGGLSTSQL